MKQNSFYHVQCILQNREINSIVCPPYSLCIANDALVMFMEYHQLKKDDIIRIDAYNIYAIEVRLMRENKVHFINDPYQNPKNELQS